MVSSGKFTDYETGRIIVWESEIEQGIKKNQLPLKTPWFIRCYNTLPSTMDVAAQIASLCATDMPGLVLAKDQSKGRGRQGRSWDASAAGFYATFSFIGMGDLSKIHSFPLVTACVLAEVLSELGCKLSVKWPNDLLSEEGKKVSGILIELLKENERGHLLVGIGVNLIGEPSQHDNSTSLFTLTGRKFTPPQIASILSPRLHAAFLVTEKSGFDAFRDQWLSFAKGLGRSISIHVGSEIVSGIFEGVTKEGHLLITQDGKSREISSGELIS